MVCLSHLSAPWTELLRRPHRALRLFHILNVLARLTSTAPPLSVETSLQLKVAPVANTARYDQLRTTDEESRLPDLEIRNDIL